MPLWILRTEIFLMDELLSSAVTVMSRLGEMMFLSVERAMLGASMSLNMTMPIKQTIAMTNKLEIIFFMRNTKLT